MDYHSAGATMGLSHEPSKPGAAMGLNRSSHIAVLDGWRAVSIFLVLAGHMLPLGPKTWGLNAPVAALGMAIFFNLSGFLIVSILLRDQNIPRFLVKRVARIIPLAWAVLAIVFLVSSPSWAEIKANFAFYANLPPFYLSRTGHFWSLCVEMQFYGAIAISVLLSGKRFIHIVPIAAIFITGYRIYSGVSISIITLWRVDEILAGGVLSLIINSPSAVSIRHAMEKIPVFLAALLFIPSTYEIFVPFDYARPYLCALLIGTSIVQSKSLTRRLLETTALKYFARVSYAVYIIHPYTMTGWLGEGMPLIKYSKRVLSFILTFSFAHFSSFYYERFFSNWAHRVTKTRPKISVAALQSRS